ncbi:hypothetical protein EZV73_17155 [Acidaminobacter sp. JC074]|uniref:hypothetical protein n=1 Tax=Acidaminobacter sp. JC074 TaxID=2530199 RepID=UPI001F10258D|nr:hypothetical protein [Acidaminobacter sp. JC074]MCH4889329.1 hypothetical protein [Acidaminobacter sp. JC074]
MKSTKRLEEILTTTDNLNTFLESNKINFIDSNFVDLMKVHIDNQTFSKYQILNDAHIDLNYGYQILNGRRKPHRNKVIQLGLAMLLPLKETQELLSSSSNSRLYIRDRRDAIIMYAIDQQLGVMETENLLNDQNEKTLIEND